MNHTSASAPLLTPPQPQAATAQVTLESDRSTNKRIRELLSFYGLRTSLIRLKVINALLVAAREQRAIGVQGVHAWLGSMAADLSFISVREVLKRLCEEGVIEFQDRSYRFTTQASTILNQHSG